MQYSRSSLRWRAALIVALVVWGWTSSGQAQTSQCASDLDGLRVVVDAAQEAVRHASATRRETRVAEEQYVRCAQLTVDEPFDAGCRQQQTAANATQVAAGAASEVSRQALGRLASAVHGVELSCEFPMAGMISVPATDDSAADAGACESFLRRRPGVPVATLRVLCDGEMSAEACEACLSDR